MYTDHLAGGMPRHHDVEMGDVADPNAVPHPLTDYYSTPQFGDLHHDAGGSEPAVAPPHSADGTTVTTDMTHPPQFAGSGHEWSDDCHSGYLSESINGVKTGNYVKA